MASSVGCENISSVSAGEEMREEFYLLLPIRSDNLSLLENPSNFLSHIIENSLANLT